MNENDVQTPAPWWKFGHMWLVVGGPVVVVIASFITLYIAVTRIDPVVSADYYRQGIEINKTLGNETNLAPALQARNHAATGVPLSPQPPVKP